MDTKEPKLDRRIERTHQLLSEALMALIVERGYESITIQDIADRANVSRTTFYLHYKDKDELLFASMTKIYDGLVSGSKHQEMFALNEDVDDFDNLDCDASDFEHVAEYADFYRMMLSKRGSLVFVLRVMSYLADVSKPVFEAHAAGTQPNIPFGLMAAFFAGAEVGVMKWWLENDMPYTPEEMARMQFVLSVMGLRAALGMDAPIAGGA